MVKELIVKPLSADRRADVWYLKQLTQACRDGELDVYTSVLSIAECTHADQDISRPVKVRLESLLMSGQYVKLVQLTPFIATDARDLRWNHGIAQRR